MQHRPFIVAHYRESMVSRYRKYRLAAALIAAPVTGFLGGVYYLQCGTFAAILQGGCDPPFPNALRQVLADAIPLFRWITAPAAWLMPNFERFEHLPGPHWLRDWIPATLLVILMVATWAPILGTAFVAMASRLTRPSRRVGSSPAT